MNATTKRHPRTLEEAFGPHTDRRIEEPHPTGYSPAWWVCLAVIAMLAVVVIVLGKPR